MMKSKKAEGGWLPEETGKIVLSIIGILILMALGVKLYGIVKESNLNKAEYNLNLLHEEIKKVENKEKNSTQIIVESPKDWWVMGFSGDSGLPKGYIENCICICKKKRVEKCNSNGACRNLQKKINYFEPIKLKGPVELSVSRDVNNNTVIEESVV